VICRDLTVLLLGFSASVILSPAQTCSFSVGALNRARGVIGSVHAECSGSIHSAPFGNWGASSPFGSKRNGHQFDGWCRNKWVCDNYGNCRSKCTDQWYEWNSCTDVAQFRPPNCSLYNSASCTQQQSATDVNVLGTYYGQMAAECPYDTNGDGYCDAGGCKAFQGIYLESTYMSLYELDPVCCDSLVQTVYFPATWIPLACTPWSCPAAGSLWVNPSKYDSPTSPAKVRAQFAIASNWGVFSDPNQVCAKYAQTDRRYNCR
jgi:hypothetical protein